MGLFDYVRCKYQLPKPSFDLDSWKIDLNQLEYQTKDLENCMWSYIISEDGRLLKHIEECKYVHYTEEEKKQKDPILKNEINNLTNLIRIEMKAIREQMWLEFCKSAD